MASRPITPSSLSAVFALLAAITAAGGASAQPRLDLAVKATFLYKLAPFVDWPAAAAGSYEASFDICVVGDDPFGQTLDHAVTGQQIGGRQIMVRRMAVATRDAPCKIMFIGGSRAQSVREALKTMRGAPVLTVTDDQASGGVIDFVIDQGRVHFRIDDQAAADDGLTVSSKLLSLAVSVNPRRGSGGRR